MADQRRNTQNRPTVRRRPSADARRQAGGSQRRGETGPDTATRNSETRTDAATRRSEARPRAEQASTNDQRTASTRPARPRSSASSEMRRSVTQWRTYGIIGFAVIMLLGGIIGLLFFLRPGISDLENRELTKFPEFTVQTFLNGAFFTDVSLWYADTYPIREPMVKASQDMKGTYGVLPETRMIGGNRQSDELPPEGETTPTVNRTHDHNVTEPEVRAAAAGIEDQIKDGVYVTNDACYTLYYFSQQATQDYAAVINDAADMLGDKAQVYSILIPTNAGIMLDDEVLESLGSPNQDQAIKYFYSLMNDNIITVPTYDILREHRDEYIFFRTDFHWTQLGAYYVYLSYCEQRGIEPAPFFDWEKMVFEPFVGEYSEETDVSNITPDAVEAYIPQGTNEMLYWHDDSNVTLDNGTKGFVVEDFSKNAEEGDTGTYNCFVCGNQPVSYIENPKVTDGSSCLIIKDSFGNPFVATLVDNYQYIWTLDFRFTNQKLMDMVEKYNIQDVIFENTIMFAGTNNCVNLLSSIVYDDKHDGSSSTSSENSEESSSSASADEG